MAITTYSELQTAVANWLRRSDLTDRIPEFIAVAESQMRREMQTLWMETRTTDTTVAGTEYIDMPSGFVCEVRNVRVTNVEPTMLDLWSLHELHRKYSTGAATDRPTAYAVSGSRIYLGPTPDAAYTVEIDYMVMPALSDSNTTSDILTHYPDVYLYMTLEAASLYLKDDQAAVRWRSMADLQISSARAHDKRARFGASPLRTKAI